MHSLSVTQIIPKPEQRNEKHSNFEDCILVIFLKELNKHTAPENPPVLFIGVSTFEKQVTCAPKLFPKNPSLIENCIKSGSKYGLHQTSVGIVQILKHIKSNHPKPKRHPKPTVNGFLF